MKILLFILFIFTHGSLNRDSVNMKETTENYYVQDSVSITYIANEGFLISVNNKKILIDALFKKVFTDYDAPNKELVEKITKSISPYESVDMYLVTHRHKDHFHPNMVYNYLTNNNQIYLISTLEVRNELANVSSNASIIEDRVIAPKIDLGENYNLSKNGIDVSVVRLWHSSYGRVINFVYIITIDGIKILHVGDITFDINYDFVYNLKELFSDIDIAFIQYFDLSNKSANLIKECINPQKIIFMHVPPIEIDEVKKETMKHFPSSEIFSRQEEKKIIYIKPNQ